CIPPPSSVLPTFLACFFFFQAEDGIRDRTVTGVQTCALPISPRSVFASAQSACACSAGKVRRRKNASRRIGRSSATTRRSWLMQIGRASCRERGESSVGGGALRRENRGSIAEGRMRRERTGTV